MAPTKRTTTTGSNKAEKKTMESSKATGLRIEYRVAYGTRTKIAYKKTKKSDGFIMLTGTSMPIIKTTAANKIK